MLRLTAPACRLLAVTALTVGALLALAAPAGAHVTVGADDTARNAADSIITIRVPNEEEKAATVKVEIAFPGRNPIASVKPAAKPGWTVTTTAVTFDPPITTDDGTITSGVGRVTYTAKTAADGIQPGRFDTFQLLVGPLPDAASVAFPTVQTYSDGTVVRWIEPALNPAQAPEHPAPTLALTPATAPVAATVAVAPASNGDPLLAIIGIVLGALGLIAGGLALSTRRQQIR